ncbi:MAG: transglutaminase family protein [Verrucomicrobiota bacterium]
MRFSVSHTTIYRYAEPASESVAELRLCPTSDAQQTVEERQLAVDPSVPVGSFVDYWGNPVEYFAIPFRHSRLTITSTSTVETLPQDSVEFCRNVTVAEAKQILSRYSVEMIDFRRPTKLVPIGGVLRGLNSMFFREGESIVDTVTEVNHWIHDQFDYVPGATDITTPIDEVIELRKGVCQDFAHVMLSILRTGGIPARYVSGYIEPYDPTQKKGSELVGAAASHAWVEVGLPGGRWWGLDPTNDQAAGERHIKVAIGRDYNDVAPFRGTFRGVDEQDLAVKVRIERLPQQ